MPRAAGQDVGRRATAPARHLGKSGAVVVGENGERNGGTEMTVGHKLAVVGAAFALGLFPLGTRASAIMGNTTGQTVTVPPTASHPRNRDDADTATTTDISYINVSPFITNGASAYPSYHFVFAGQPGIGSQFQPISPSDFTIVQYNPWVVNNNRNTNGITGPDGINYNRGVTNRDGGGADILILYTPLNAGDPTRVNFVQAFAQNTNSTGLSQGTIDAGGSTRPYYNVAGLSGTGTTNRTGTSPLVTSPNAPAWMVDIPGRCENGPLPAGPPRGLPQRRRRDNHQPGAGIPDVRRGGPNGRGTDVSGALRGYPVGIHVHH